MKWLIGIVVVLVLLVAAALLAGFLLPAQAEYTRTITLKQTPEAVFTALADVQKMPDWDRHIARVEMLPPTDGKETSRQTFKNGMVITLVTTESLSPTHLVREDKEGRLGGSWSYEIAPTNDGSKITVIDKVEVDRPMLRVIGRIFGPTKYLDEHLTDLARHFGEQGRPR